MIRTTAFAVRRTATSACRRRFKSTTNNASTTATAEASTTTTKAEGVPIAASLAAAIAGVGVVAATTFAVEQTTADSCLPYSSVGGAQRFNQDTFAGRFARMLLACDPTLLIYTEDQVRAAQHVLLVADQQQQSDDTNKNSATQQQDSRSLWESKRIVDGAVHPDTGEFIPRPFRMSGYVPYNGPICVSMVAATSTMPLLFWAWINQSQNALVNYYNRNASSPMTNETLLKSYSAAVGSAIVVAFGLSTFVQKRFPAEKAKQMMKFVAFPSAVVASSLNCYVVRSPEIATGVPLMDANGKTVLEEEGATSQIAAKRGVESTTASRALLQAPVYFLPSLLMSTLPPLKNLIERNPRIRVPLTTFLVLVAFGLGLPATIAIFPQVSELKASEAETKYQHLIDPTTQKPYEVFYYNKGL